MPVRAILRCLTVLVVAGLTLLAAPSRADAQFAKRPKDAVKVDRRRQGDQQGHRGREQAIDKAMSGGASDAGVIPRRRTPPCRRMRLPRPRPDTPRPSSRARYYAREAKNYGYQPPMLFAAERNLDSPREPHVRFGGSAGIGGPKEFTTARPHGYRDSLYKVTRSRH